MVRMSTTPALFLESLRVINEILRQNADRAPLNQLLAQAKHVVGERSLTIAVYRGEPSIEVDHFMVRIVDDEFDLVMRGRQSDAVDLSLPHSFLEDVVDNQERYLDDPASMEWCWLEELGKTARSGGDQG